MCHILQFCCSFHFRCCFFSGVACMLCWNEMHHMYREKKKKNPTQMSSPHCRYHRPKQRLSNERWREREGQRDSMQPCLCGRSKEVAWRWSLQIYEKVTARTWQRLILTDLAVGGSERAAWGPPLVRDTHREALHHHMNQSHQFHPELKAQRHTLFTCRWDWLWFVSAVENQVSLC